MLYILKTGCYANKVISSQSTESVQPLSMRSLSLCKFKTVAHTYTHPSHVHSPTHTYTHPSHVHSPLTRTLTPHTYTHPSHIHSPLTHTLTPHTYTHPSHIHSPLTRTLTPHTYTHPSHVHSPLTRTLTHSHVHSPCVVVDYRMTRFNKLLIDGFKVHIDD